jgi:hypothetical protein
VKRESEVPALPPTAGCGPVPPKAIPEKAGNSPGSLPPFSANKGPAASTMAAIRYSRGGRRQQRRSGDAGFSTRQSLIPLYSAATQEKCALVSSASIAGPPCQSPQSSQPRHAEGSSRRSREVAKEGHDLLNGEPAAM